MWKILLILEPVGNGPGGKDGVWEKGDVGARGNLFGKSHLENLMRRGQSVRDGGLRKRRGSGVRAGSRLHLFHTLVTIQPNTTGKSE